MSEPLQGEAAEDFQLYPSVLNSVAPAERTQRRLLFVLTPGMRLQDWKANGTLRREIQPYLYHIRQGGKVAILQYRRASFRGLPAGISLIRVPHWRLSWLWEMRPPHLIQTFDVIKTNQSYLSHQIVRMAQRWNKPVVLRCGYIRGQQLEIDQGLVPSVQAYHAVEGWAFRNATLVQIPVDDNWVVDRYGVDPQRIRIVPNFVDTAQFCPREDGPAPLHTRIISVGRLHEIKRFDLLLQACTLVDNVTLSIAGDGPERGALMDLAHKLNVKCKFPGQIPNEQLPAFVRQGSIFAITSRREGHPKALIEAMACGLPCISVDAPGLRNLVQHEMTGLLVEDTPQAIAHAIHRITLDKDLRMRLGRNARQYATDKFDICSILRLHESVIEEAFQIKMSQ